MMTSLWYRFLRWLGIKKEPIFAMYDDHCEALHNPPDDQGRPDRNLQTFHSGYKHGPEKCLYYYIVNDTPDIEEKKLEIVVIARAIDRWESRIDFPIIRAKTATHPSPANLYWDGPNGLGAVITITFVPSSKMSNKGALAEASRGFMRINDDWGWGIEPEDVALNLGFVVCHEFGHNLKYLHSNCPNCVMNSRYQDKKADLQEFELHDAIEIDYGANPKWETSSVFRKNHQDLWNKDLNQWWADFKKRNRNFVGLHRG